MSGDPDPYIPGRRFLLATASCANADELRVERDPELRLFVQVPARVPPLPGSRTVQLCCIPSTSGPPQHLGEVPVVCSKGQHPDIPVAGNSSLFVSAGQQYTLRCALRFPPEISVITCLLQGGGEPDRPPLRAQVRTAAA
jgi:hypothetical protein